jgi:hypothetical protein
MYPRTTSETRPGPADVIIWLAAAAVVAAVLVALTSHPALALPALVQDTERSNTQYGNWAFGSGPSYSGGWSASTRTPGSTAILKFRGTSVAWKTVTYDGGGVTDVFLDGRKVVSFDSYSSTQRYGVTGFSRKGLPRGKHTLKLVATGTRGPGAPPGDVFSIVDRFKVNGTTLQENSRKISYDGWSGAANRKASGGTYRQGTSTTLGARCGLFSGNSEIGLITATGPTRGTATVRALKTFDNSVAKEVTVDLHSSTVEWQHVVPVTGLEQNRLYILEVISADGKPVVFDGCTGDLRGPIN